MRRIEVECESGHQEELVIGAKDKIPKCPRATSKETKCGKRREILWRGGSAGFRVQGLTKRF